MHCRSNISSETGSSWGLIQDGNWYSKLVDRDRCFSKQFRPYQASWQITWHVHQLQQEEDSLGRTGGSDEYFDFYMNIAIASFPQSGIGWISVSGLAQEQKIKSEPNDLAKRIKLKLIPRLRRKHQDWTTEMSPPQAGDINWLTMLQVLPACQYNL